MVLEDETSTHLQIITGSIAYHLRDRKMNGRSSSEFSHGLTGVDMKVQEMVTLRLEVLGYKTNVLYYCHDKHRLCPFSTHCSLPEIAVPPQLQHIPRDQALQIVRSGCKHQVHAGNCCRALSVDLS